VKTVMENDKLFVLGNEHDLAEISRL
jgi:hypothetical protein